MNIAVTKGGAGKMDDPKYYYFTFGLGTLLRRKYIKLYGTYGETRSEMMDSFGSHWAFQYSEDEWNAKYPLYFTNLKELELN